MADATGVNAFFDLVRKERAEAEKHNQPAIETKIEEKQPEQPAQPEPEAQPETEAPAVESTEE